MGSLRLLSALALLGAAVVIGVVVHDAAPGPDAGSGSFPTTVEGPDGTLFNGSVAAQNATAFTVLLAAAEQGGFDVEATGSGSSLFVRSIAGHENEGAGGWCYAVWQDGWLWPAQSAGSYGLQDGQATRWVYFEDGCPGFG